MKPFKWKCIFLNNRNSNVLGVVIVIAFSRVRGTLRIQVRAKDEQPWIICPPWAFCHPYASVPPSTPCKGSPVCSSCCSWRAKWKIYWSLFALTAKRVTLVARSNMNGMNAFFSCSQTCLKPWQVSGRADLGGTGLKDEIKTNVWRL